MSGSMTSQSSQGHTWEASENEGTGKNDINTREKIIYWMDQQSVFLTLLYKYTTTSTEIPLGTIITSTYQIRRGRSNDNTSKLKRELISRFLCNNHLKCVCTGPDLYFK